MEPIPQKFSRCSRLRLWLRMALLIVAFIASWYIVVRIASPWNVVKIMELKTAESPVPDSAQASGTLRVGCYNIAHGRGGHFGAANWDGGSRAKKLQRLTQIGRLLNQANLDIVVLNEVDFSSFWSGHINQAKIIARQAGYPYLAEQRNVDAAVPFVRLRFGNAILSRFPISEAVFLDYPHPSWLQEILVGGIKDGLAATVTLPDGSEIQIVAVHLSLAGEAYRHPSVKLFMDLHNDSSLPMIAMGDFNSTAAGFPGHTTDDDGRNCIDTLLADDRWSMLSPNPSEGRGHFTFPSQDPDRVIDWIFVTEPWHIQSKTVIQTDLSDHLPVIAIITKSINNI